MIGQLLALTAAAGLFAASVFAVRWVETERLRRELVSYRVEFGRELSADAVTAFMTGLTGIVGSRATRLISPRAVILEVTATGEDIVHRLHVPRPLTGIVSAQLAAAMPDVRLQTDQTDAPAPTLAAELALSQHHRPLRVEHPEMVAASLLASLQPLDHDESVTVQVVLSPLGPVASVTQPKARAGTLEVTLVGSSQVLHDAEAIRLARAKRALPLFAATVRLGVRADANQDRLLMRRLLAPFQTVTAPGVHLYRRRVSSRWTAAAMTRHSIPVITWPLTLNASELTALVGFPIGVACEIRGVRLAAGRLYPPAQGVLSHGRIIGDSIYPGRERPVAITAKDALLHTWVGGPTGVGKSTLLANLIEQDIVGGHAVVVIDPKRDLVAAVQDRIGRHDVDVIVLDIADDRPVGFNVLAGSQLNPELVADQVLAILHRLYRAWWGPRTADVLLASLSTVAHQPAATLLDVPLILTNETMRRRLVGAIDDPVLEGFWATYEAMSPAEQAQAIGPVLNKLRQFLLRPSLRAVLGQPMPTFTLEEVINRGKVLLVSLPPGEIGEEAAALIGSLIVARLWQAIQGRVTTPNEDRRPVMAYIDEFQTFAHLPMPLDDVLAKARGLGAGFVLANQSLSQLPPELKNAVLANCRSKIAFQASSTDATVIAREMGGGLRAEDIVSLPAYTAVATLAAAGQVSPPVTIRTRPMSDPIGSGDAIRATSRQRYGRDRVEVETAWRDRQTEPKSDAPTLRRKRGDR